MNDPKHRQLRELFEQALELSAEQRSIFLSARCAGQPELRQRIEALLAAAEDERFLASPTGAVAGELAAPHVPNPKPAATPALALGAEQPGAHIGPYKLLQLIGEGGFGEVFLAQQEEPVRRKVALKILKLGMDTRQIVARFEQERQALALMDHPNIARVFDAGVTLTGRSYFVMELVQGDPIVAYCDALRLTIEQRLELLAQVCSAVQHAHQKGIIHRDLKPSNVLVGTLDGRPHAKVIDFGIAKATSQKMTDKTLFTEHRQVIGTFQYMSPEQAHGSLDIDTRTDVYSLGVLLYELLTGSTPFDAKTLSEAAYGEIQRLIREVDPPRPSTRLSSSRERLASIAAHRGIEPRRLGVLVRGDLDWIVMKSLEKDRARRYESASDLAADLRRHLDGDAVLAAPPSAGYRLRKLAQRHRGLVAASGAVTLSLVAGVAAFAWQASVARDERDAANLARIAESEQRRIVEEQREIVEKQRVVAAARADEFERLAEFQAEMLEQIDPSRAGRMLTEDVLARFEAALEKADVPVSERAELLAQFRAQWGRIHALDVAKATLDRALLQPSAAAIETQFADYPGVAAKLRQRLAGVYGDLGLYSAALPLQESALQLRRKVYGDDGELTLRSMKDLGILLWHLGRYAEAEPLYREVLERCTRAHVDDAEIASSARDSLAVLLHDVGRSAEAEPIARQALEERRSRLGEDHPDTLNSMSNLALVLEGLGRLSEAEALYRDTLARRRRVLGDEHTATLVTLNNLGALLRTVNQLDEAEVLLREAVATRTRVFGEDHPERLYPLNNLGLLLNSQGRFAEAELICREVLAARERLLGWDHSSTLSARNNLASVLLATDRAADAEPILRAALDARRRLFDALHPETLGAVNNLGMALHSLGRNEEAEPLQREVLEGLRKALGPNHPNTIASHLNLGVVLQAQGKFAEAEALFVAARTAARRAFSAGHPVDLSATGSLAKLLIAQSRFGEAVSLLSEALPHFRRAPGERSAASTARMLVLLGRSRGKLAASNEEFHAAERELLEAEATLVGIPGQKPTDRGECLAALVELHAAWDKLAPGAGHAESSASWQSKLDAAK
ncbi:MAG: serine/threonine protein kinase [Planctomycetes bacterium]|nr:serine/threonine protein kinase [Planctomycetota bacterium]